MFERIQASSHVVGLCLQANCVIGSRDASSFHQSWTECDHRNVSVRTLWDNPLLHEEVKPKRDSVLNSMIRPALMG